MLHPKFHHLYPNAKNDYNEAVLFYHRLMEAYKFAYSRRMHLGDDRFDNCTNVLSQLTSKDYIDKIVEKINDATTYPSKSGFYDVDVRFLGFFFMFPKLFNEFLFFFQKICRVFKN